MILTFLRKVLVPEVAHTRVRPDLGEEGDHAFRSDAKAEGEVVVLWEDGHVEILPIGESADGIHSAWIGRMRPGSLRLASPTVR